MLQLETTVLDRLADVPWFEACGTTSGRPALQTAVHWIEHRDEALRAMVSVDWLDAKTHAQGQLTGALSRMDYQNYGSKWNVMAARAGFECKQHLGTRINEAVARMAFGPRCAEMILLDITRAVLEASFRAVYPKAPYFFGDLALLYEHGHLPCGWRGRIDQWPQGALVAF